MYTSHELNEEIKAAISTKAENQEEMNPATITTVIIHSHRHDCSAFDDFFTCNAFLNVRAYVGKAITRWLKDHPDDRPGDTKEQLEMYPLLQAYYMVEVDEVVIAKPRKDMAYSQRIAQAEKMIADGEKRILHGEQLNAETRALVASGALIPDSAAA